MRKAYRLESVPPIGLEWCRSGASDVVGSMVSFLHTADLHLGLRTTRFNPEVAKKIREARFQALENIRQAAKERHVDFVLVAGDLFDDHAVDADIAGRAYDLLESFPAPVYVLSGNHDPLLAGSVWDRPPWNRTGPKRVCVLREPKPLEFAAGILLFPCPVFRKTCRDDPTAWVAKAAPNGSAIRIGIAHGSLKTREDLPADDHLIARHAVHELKLDYLALGHWHSRQWFDDPAGAMRTAYCGVHEPLRFPGTSDNRTGWLPYSGGNRQEFLDSGKGEVLHVCLERPGALPQIESIEVGHLVWEDEKRSLATNDDMSRLIDEIGIRPTAERRLLRLKLEGVLDAQSMLRVQQLREVLDRYLLGEVDDSGLHLRPTEEEIRERVGLGILHRVFEQLQHDARGDDEAARRVAERAILLLYQIAHEVPS